MYTLALAHLRAPLVKMSSPTDQEAQPFVNKEITLLQGSSAELVKLLPSAALVKFSRELFKFRVVEKGVKDILASMDQESVNKELPVRYLVQQVCEGVKRDGTVFGRFVGALDKLSGSEKLVSRLSKELGQLDKGGNVEADCGDVYLYEHDIPMLLDILNDTSDRWEHIGIALHLHQVRINEFRSKRDSCTINLNNILCEWMSSKENTTLKILVQALAGGIVRRIDFANKLEKDFRKAKEAQAMIPAARGPHLDSTLKVVYQSCDTEVVDGKSTLLEVQVSPNESASYQWLKDGRPLSDGVAYSGVGCDILVISLARQGTEGAYVCRISQGTEKVTSDVVALTINFPPEKKALIPMYKRQDDVPPDTWPPVVNCPFINLALIKKSKRSGSKSYDYSVQGNMDDILESKERIKYDECLARLEVES